MSENSQASVLSFDAVPTQHQELKLWLRMLGCTTTIEKQLRQRFKTEFDTTLPRFDVLAALYRHPEGLRMSDLSRWLMVSNGNATCVVNRLAADGLVNRAKRPGDKRTILVQLSKSGRKEFERQSAAHEQWLKELFGGLSQTNLDRLQSLLDKAKQSVAAGMIE